MAWNTDLRWRLPLTCLLLQVALVVLFGVFVRYNPDADAHWVEDKQHANSSSDLDNEFYYRYPSKCRRPAGPRSAQLSGSPPGPESCLAAPLQPTLGTRAGAGVGDAAHGSREVGDPGSLVQLYPYSPGQGPRWLIYLPALLPGEVGGTMAPKLCWLGEGEGAPPNPWASKRRGLEHGLESPHLTSLWALPFTRWVTLGKCQPR